MISQQLLVLECFLISSRVYSFSDMVKTSEQCNERRTFLMVVVIGRKRSGLVRWSAREVRLARSTRVEQGARRGELRVRFSLKEQHVQYALELSELRIGCRMAPEQHRV